ncbi:DUF4349 domain-containing protein [Candidatus Woesearchaeota archaeon]|nr:DUF4349 domain-containing protein [Candidatus Woesearchaeota archaeon]
MTVGDQWRKIKDNWLLIVIPFVLLFLLAGGLSSLTSQFRSVSSDFSAKSYAPSYAAERAEGRMPVPMVGGFAPEAVQRLIEKTARMAAEIERGQFDGAVDQLKALVKSSDAYALNENIARQGDGMDEYRTGSFDLKIESKKYDAFVAQLKKIGELKSFTENAEDVTGFHKDLNIQLEGERERLKRYEALYDDAKEVKDKIELSDRIFNQQNLIKQLEASLKNIDEQVSYSSVGVYLEEERSSFAGIGFVGFGELITAFVGSLSGLLYFLMSILPWAVALWLVVMLWRKVKGKKR